MKIYFAGEGHELVRDSFKIMKQMSNFLVSYISVNEFASSVQKIRMEFIIKFRRQNESKQS